MARDSHRNISFATAEGLKDLLHSGTVVTVRGERVREIRNRLTILRYPTERCLFLPQRGNDVVATIAETMWVLAGKIDATWLSYYLPRALQFSDDGQTWHGAYGPRLRNWNGIDQLNETRKLLLHEPATRRAVMSLFDPGRDYIHSQDIPCNNWLQWLIRDGRLNLTVGVRSNDVVWGFSGINSFQWSVLQEMMAVWTGSVIGEVAYLATSFHLYEHHIERARRMVRGFNGVTCYEFGLRPPPFQTPFDDFDLALNEWFRLELELRGNANQAIDIRRKLPDPLLASMLEIIRIHNGVKGGWSVARLREELGQLVPNDLAAAAYEFYSRKYPSIADNVLDKRISEFIASFRGANQSSKSFVNVRLLERVKRLHAGKSAAYGKSWKRRGELLSVLPNIARKVDRLERCVLEAREYVDEPSLDTAVDLFVYLIKYQLFLSDCITGSASPSGRSEQPGISDTVDAFDALTDRYSTFDMSDCSAKDLVKCIVGNFETIYESAHKTEGALHERLQAATQLSDLAYNLVRVLSDPSVESAEQSLRTKT